MTHAKCSLPRLPPLARTLTVLWSTHLPAKKLLPVVQNHLFAQSLGASSPPPLPFSHSFVPSSWRILLSPSLLSLNLNVYLLCPRAHAARFEPTFASSGKYHRRRRAGYNIIDADFIIGAACASRAPSITPSSPVINGLDAIPESRRRRAPAYDAAHRRLFVFE